MREPLWLWVVVAAGILSLVALDSLVMSQRSLSRSPKEALLVALAWVAVGLGFGLGVLVLGGSQRAEEYFSAYLLEKLMSVDNVAVLALVFAYFRVQQEHQHRVVFDVWSVAGALGARVVLIVLGVDFLENVRWAVFPTGIVVLLTAVQVVRGKGGAMDPGCNLVIRAVARLFPTTTDQAGGAFWVRRDGRLAATPLLLALVAIEAAEVVFAFESIPAVLAVTDRAFLVFTSNVLALLGMRAAYLALSRATFHLERLRIGLALSMLFVGVKLLISHAVELPASLSLGVMSALLLGSLGASVVVPAQLGRPERGLRGRRARAGSERP
ncbi:MAG TPA: TerC/Alx family metal homeostasis membrane protein [Acidimicrobiales bacterium]|nr:TerC/Alx family metal homeostasis membrane protein [Acidimicrobiales bacterium]